MPGRRVHETLKVVAISRARGRPRGTGRGRGGLETVLSTLTGSKAAEGVLLALAANTEAYPGEIAKALSLPPSAVLAQLRRFEEAELFVRRNMGRTALYAFNPRGTIGLRLKELVTEVLMGLSPEERMSFTFRRRPRTSGKEIIGE